MRDDVELIASAPSVGRPRGLAWALSALVAVTVGAVDPAGFVPTGPLRGLAIAVTTGAALGALVGRPVAVPRAMTGVWIALLAVLLVATIAAVDPLHAWIGTPDRRLGLLAWLTFPALFLAGHACTDRAATRLVLRTGALGAVLRRDERLDIRVRELVGHRPVVAREEQHDPAAHQVAPRCVARVSGSGE